MEFKIRHTKTQETRVGQWDGEGLTFLSKDGNISFSEFSHWLPCFKAPSRTIPSFIHENKTISLDNPTAFLVLRHYRPSEGVEIPVMFYKKLGYWVYFRPMVGELPFDRCTIWGNVPGSHCYVFQVSGVWNTKKRIEKFKELDICKKCYGYNKKCINCKGVL